MHDHIIAFEKQNLWFHNYDTTFSSSISYTNHEEFTLVLSSVSKAFVHIPEFLLFSDDDAFIRPFRIVYFLELGTLEVKHEINWIGMDILHEKVND